jgi:hypothetical protein
MPGEGTSRPVFSCGRSPAEGGQGVAAGEAAARAAAGCLGHGGACAAAQTQLHAQQQQPQPSQRQSDQENMLPLEPVWTWDAPEPGQEATSKPTPTTSVVHQAASGPRQGGRSVEQQRGARSPLGAVDGQALQQQQQQQQQQQSLQERSDGGGNPGPSTPLAAAFLAAAPPAAGGQAAAATAGALTPGSRPTPPLAKRFKQTTLCFTPASAQRPH